MSHKAPGTPQHVSSGGRHGVGRLKINGQLAWDYAPVNGTYQSCPATSGQWIYRLEAYRPNGMAVQEIAVTVDPVYVTPY